MDTVSEDGVKKGEVWLLGYRENWGPTQGMGPLKLYINLHMEVHSLEKRYLNLLCVFNGLFSLKSSKLTA
jgi:hypothetical protein